MTTDRLPSRRELDRVGYLNAARAAHGLRLKASASFATADNTVLDPEFGRYGEKARTEIVRAYVAAGMKLLDLAVEAEAEAANYLAHLNGAA